MKILDTPQVTISLWPSDMPAYFTSDEIVWVASRLITGTDTSAYIVAHATGDNETFSTFAFEDVVTGEMFVTEGSASASMLEAAA